MYWSQRTFLNPNSFCADQSRDIHSQYFCDPTKRNHHQTQARAPLLAQLAVTPRHTPDHLLSQAAHDLDQTSDHRRLLSAEEQVGYWWQMQGELARQQVFKFDLAKPPALHSPVLCFPNCGS